MFALVGIVCFLRQRCALGGRFPRGLTLGSHLVLSISTSSPLQAVYCDHRDSTASWCLSLFLAEEKIAELNPGTGRSPDCLKMKNSDAPAVKREEKRTGANDPSLIRSRVNAGAEK
jgi:hypothetical protein